MTAKEYLSQVLYIDQRINCKLEQVMRLRENATKATATLSDMPHSDSPNLKSMEDVYKRQVQCSCFTDAAG